MLIAVSEGLVLASSGYKGTPLSHIPTSLNNSFQLTIHDLENTAAKEVLQLVISLDILSNHDSNSSDFIIRLTVTKPHTQDLQPLQPNTPLSQR